MSKVSGVSIAFVDSGKVRVFYSEGATHDSGKVADILAKRKMSVISESKIETMPF